MCRRSVLWIYSTSSVKQANTWMRVVYNAASAQLSHNCADLNKHLLMTSTHYSPWAPDTSMTKYSKTPRYHRPGTRTRECQEPCRTHPLDRDTWCVRHNITQNNGKSEYTVIGSNKYDTINLHPSLELPRLSLYKYHNHTFPFFRTQRSFLPLSTTLNSTFEPAYSNRWSEYTIAHRSCRCAWNDDHCYWGFAWGRAFNTHLWQESSTNIRVKLHYIYVKRTI